MPSAEDYRQYAAQCLALAQQVSDPDARAHLLEMAQAWRELADKAQNPRAPKKT
jgi:hypothetical protein